MPEPASLRAGERPCPRGDQERTSSPRASTWRFVGSKTPEQVRVAAPLLVRGAIAIRRARPVLRSPRRSPAIGAERSNPRWGPRSRCGWRSPTSSCRGRRMTRARCSRRRSARAHLRAEAPVRPVREPRPDGAKLGDVRVPNSCGSGPAAEATPPARTKTTPPAGSCSGYCLAALPVPRWPGPAPSSLLLGLSSAAFA